MPWPFSPPGSDAAYDALTDELATTPAHERAHQRPSQFPSARAFINFTTVALDARAARSPSPLTPGEHDTAPGGGNPSSSAAGGRDLLEPSPKERPRDGH